MKDIIITKERQKKELKMFLVCFVIAFCLNIYAIIAYDGKWKELFWSLGFVISAAILLYLLVVVIRLCIYGAKKLFHK
ncbi:MAG: hypothetical protein ACOYJK_02130 [Prevotella sp.]